MSRDRTKQQREKGETRRGIGYAAISLAMTAAGLGGLALSYVLGDSPAGDAVAGGAPIMNGSLLGAVIEVFQGSIALPQIALGKGLAGYLPVFLYFAVPFLCAALIISAALTLISIFRPRIARRLSRQNGKLLALAYGALFLGNFLFRALTKSGFDREFFDLSAAAAAGAELLFLFLIALAEQKGRSAVNLAFLILSLLSVLGCAIPEKPLTQAIGDLVYRNGAVSVQARYAMFALCGVTILNLLLSLSRLTAGKGRFFDALRFLLQFMCVGALAGAYFSAGYATLEFLLVQPLSVALLCVCPLFAFALALLTGRRRTKVRSKKPEPAPASPPLMLPAPMDMDDDAEFAHSA